MKNEKSKLIALGCFLATLVFVPSFSCSGKPVPKTQDEGPPKPDNQAAQKLEKLWAVLGGEDASAAYQAIWTLIQEPEQSIPFLQQKLRPVSAVDSKAVAQLIGQLDHGRYAVRERATKELENMAELAEPALRRAWQGKVSPEAKKRLRQLLDQRDKEFRTSEQVRVFRAIEVIELIGSVEARKVLKTLAQGVPEARITQEAKTTLDRLAATSARPPGGD
jgi:hypothetical protein